MILETAGSLEEGMPHLVNSVDGDPGGFLSDQVICLNALLDCYEYTGAEKYLDAAEHIVGFMEGNLFDPLYGAFQLDRADRGHRGRLSISVRPFGLNCLMTEQYIRLHHLTANDAYYRAATRLVEYLFRVPLTADDLRFCRLADVWFWTNRYPVKFVMVGRPGEKYDELVAATWRDYYPRSVLIHLKTTEGQTRIGDLTFPDTDLPQLFVCDAATCSVPIVDPKSAAEMIRAFLEPSL
jgi:uncharacterized protein YyaL (SSP411 family)